ncbi:MAG: ABC transporter permease [Bacilli bacterium]|nr:ABC transporter permease [Bacilli bacterium]
MFFHNFNYTLKTLFKNKILIFWTYAFPIILGLLFYFAFSDIEKGETFKVIPIGIVENQAFLENTLYKETFQVLGEEGSKTQIFSIRYEDEETCQSLTKKKEIVGYLNLENEAKLVISENGIDETTFKFVIEEIEEKKALFNHLIEMNQDSIRNDASFVAQIYEKVMANQESSIQDDSKSHLSYTMIEYYTLIAMACLYGGILGMYAINQKLANMSSNGKRVSVAPIQKIKLIGSSALASYVTLLIGVLLLFLFTVFVLHVDYGDSIFYVLLLILFGSLAGLAFGLFISVLLKKNENTKIGIIIAGTMFCSVLSGMMGITMKYVIDKNVPILNKINPANMITDGFYALYYYDTPERFFMNLISLILFSLVLFLISIVILRGEKYDSI